MRPASIKLLNFKEFAIHIIVWKIVEHDCDGNDDKIANLYFLYQSPIFLDLFFLLPF